MGDPEGEASKNGVLALMCGVVAMTVIDLAVVNVALPSIQRDLGVDGADLQWVVVAYGVFVAGFLLFGYDQGVMSGIVISKYWLPQMGKPSTLMIGTITASTSTSAGYSGASRCCSSSSSRCTSAP